MKTLNHNEVEFLVSLAATSLHQSGEHGLRQQIMLAMNRKTVSRTPTRA